MLIKLQSFIRRCVAGIVSLLLLAGVVIGGANAAFGDSWTYTTHYEWESDTYLFPPIEQTFPLQLGDFQQNQSLAVKSIAKTGAGSGAEKCGITITWEYTANVKKLLPLAPLISAK
ncbi:hypothetical protein [Arcanobacterium hippocoleae]|uniref:hypothetical protein n=1 Tax=Arcanobacterium hippocoleae TaxID=149017 RepID=UPI003341E8F2